MDTGYSPRIKYGVLLLVVLLHAIIALLFFFILFEKKSNDIFLDKTESIDLKKDWALRSPAPIKFYDPVDEVLEKPTPTEQLLEVVPQEETSEPIPEEIVDPLTPEPARALEEYPQEKALLQVNEEPLIERVAIDFTPKKRQPIKSAKKKVLEAKRQATPPPARRPITLADLASMYQKNIADAAPENMFLQGSPDKLPPDKQISFERYKTKINTIINDMYKIYKNEMGAIPANISVQLYVEMVRKGSFKTLYIKNSSGYPLVDRCVMKIYQEASDRFPPIPKGLEEELFKGSIILRSSYYAPEQGNVWLPF